MPGETFDPEKSLASTGIYDNNVVELSPNKEDLDLYLGFYCNGKLLKAVRSKMQYLDRLPAAPMAYRLTFVDSLEGPLGTI